MTPMAWVKLARARKQWSHRSKLLQEVHVSDDGWQLVATDGHRLHAARASRQEPQCGPDDYPDYSFLWRGWSSGHPRAVALLRNTAELRDSHSVLARRRQEPGGSLGTEFLVALRQKRQAIVVDPGYLRDALRGFGELVWVVSSGPHHALFLSDLDGRCAIVMPMRVKGTKGTMPLNDYLLRTPRHARSAQRSRSTSSKGTSTRGCPGTPPLGRRRPATPVAVM